MTHENDVVVDELRAALRNFPTGVTVVTAIVDDLPCGLTVSSFTSVSLDPPSVLFCVNASARTHDQLLRAERVGVSILSGDQGDIATAFATAGGEKFSTVAWHDGSLGVPLIDDAAAHLQGTITDRHSIGTHTVFVMRVDDVDGGSIDPLVYFQRRFVHGRILADPDS